MMNDNDIGITLSADDKALLAVLRDAGSDIQAFAKQGGNSLRDLQDAARGNATAIEKLASGMKTAFIGGGVAASIITLKNAVEGVTMAMLDAQMQADKVKNSLSFAMGGPQAAAEIQYLRQVTDQLGVSFANVAPMYGRLAAATKGTNLEGRATREIFESIAQASVVMGLGVEETEGAMRALVQMVSKGQIQAEELRGQLGERLPRAFQLFAESMGVTTGELSKLLETGKVGTERLAQFAATLKGALAGDVDEATTRLAASVNRLDNAWLRLKQNVGEAGVSSFMSGQMAILADATSDVATSMEKARAGGDGFAGQMLAAAGAVARFINPFNAIGYSVQDQATALKEAEKQLKEYEALLAKDPTNTFLIRGIQQIKETVVWLQAANAEKNKFAASGPSHRQMENASMAKLAEQEAAQMKELAEIRAKLNHVDKDYLPTLTKLHDAFKSGAIPTQKEYVDLVGKLAKENYKAEKATGAHADAFGEFIKKVNEKIIAQRLELDSGRKLSESDKLRIQFNEELGSKYKKLTAAQLAQVDALLKALKAGEDQERTLKRLKAEYLAFVEFQDEVNAGYVAESKAREQGRLAVDAYVQAIAESNAQIGLEQSLFGQSQRDRDIALEQYRIELDLKKQIAAINANAGFDQAQRDEMIAKATAAATVAKAAAVAKADLGAMTSILNAVESTAHDVFVNVFDSGSSAFKKLGQTLKASVLDLLYQMTLKKWVLQVGASVTGSVYGSAANAATSGLSGGSSLLSAGSSLAALAGGFNTASTLGAFGSSFMGSAGVAIGLEGAGSALAASSAASSAAGFGGASSAGAALGAVAPYLAAAIAIYYIAKSLDHSGTPHTGGGSSYSASAGLSSTAVGRWTGGTTWGDGFGSVMGSQSTVDMTAQLTQSIVGILDSTATAFGQQAGYAAATSFADDSSKDGAWGSLLLKLGDTVLADWNAARTSKWAPKVFSDGAAGSAEYLAAVSADVRKALDGIGLPAWATQMLNSLGDAPALDQLAATVAEINKTQNALASIGKVLVGFAGLSDAAVQSLIKASGGIDALAIAAASYYENFYTQEERNANLRQQMNAALGEVGVNTAQLTSRAAFREYVEYLQTLSATQPGATAALAAMLQWSDEFALLTPVVDAATGAIDDAGTVIGRTAADIANSITSLKAESGNLQVELLSAMGNDQGAAELRRTLDTAGMTEAEIAIYDYNEGIRAQIKTLRDAKTAADQLADRIKNLTATGNNLQVELLSAMGNDQGAAELRRTLDTAGMTEAEIAIYDYNEGIRAQIKILRDAKTAADQLADRIKNLTATGNNLQVELLSAMGNDQGAAELRRTLDTAGMSEAEIAIYDYNEGIRAQIRVLKAAAEAARAEAQQRESLQTTLLQALGETATLRQRGLAAMTPANRVWQQMIYDVQDAQSAINALNTDIARLSAVASQASGLSNSLGVLLGGTDNTEARLWATVNSATATAEDKLAAVSELMGIINDSISTDTQEAQRLLTEGATAAQQAIEAANAAQREGAQAQLEAAQKLLDYGRQLTDYVQGLRIGATSTLTPGEKLALAAQAYQKSLTGAQASDPAAMASLQGDASAYLDLARQYDPAAYNGIFANVTGTLGGFGASLMTEGQRAQATADATLAAIQAVGGSASATTTAVITGNVISDLNRAHLESLLALTTQIEADAVIERAQKEAQITAETARIEAIRLSLADTGVIALSVSSTADAMTNLATQQKEDSTLLRGQIAALTTQVQDLQATIVNMTAAQIEADQQVGTYVATTVAGAVTQAVAAKAPEIV